MKEAIERASRQLLLPGWTLKKQQLLTDVTAVADSRWGLAALYLAGAGVVNHRLTDGPQFERWRRHITNLLPVADVKQTATDGSALSLYSVDSTLVTLTLEGVGAECTVRLESDGLTRTLATPVTDGAAGELLLSATLATITLNWFIYRDDR